MKKILTIGVISMLLLVGISTISTGAKDAEGNHELKEGKILEKLMFALKMDIEDYPTNQKAVYKINNMASTMGDWLEHSILPAPDGGLNDEFGYSVCIDGDHLIIGAREAGSFQTGAAYIFKNDGTNWKKEAKLVASDGTHADTFGSSVSISGDYAIVGAPYQYNSIGAAYIFKRSGTT